MRFFALHLGLLAVFVAGAWAAGRIACSLAGFDRRREPAAAVHRRAPLAAPALAPIVGLALLAWAGNVLGLFGLLTRAALLALLGVVWIAAGFLRLTRARRGGDPGDAETRTPLVAAAAVAALATLVGLPLLALALYPPTAFDETLYHLPFARAFADSGGLPFLPELRFPVFPQLGEVLQAALLAFAGDVATHFVSLLAIGLTAALLWAWGEEWGGAERPWIGPLAAAIWLGNPLVVYLGATSYVDPLLALFVTAAAYVHWRFRDAPGGLVLAGFLTGAAAGTKYLGLFFVAALGVATLFGTVGGGVVSGGGAGARSRRLRDVCLFGVAALVAMAPSYGRIIALTGNPLFPYLSGLFGENAWTPRHFRNFALPTQSADWVAGLARGAGRLLTLPWDVVARRDRVGGLPPLSPAYLLGLPLLVATTWRRRAKGALGKLLFAPLLFLLLFPLLPADVRYLIAPLPLFSLGLAVALAGGLTRWVDRSPPALTARARLGPFAAFGSRLVLVALVVGLLALPGSLYALHRLVLQGPLPTTPVERDLYLRRMLPPFSAIAYVNERIRPGETIYGLHLESMRYLARGRFLGDWYGPCRFGLLLERLPVAESFDALLRSWRVDYLAVARNTPAGETLARGRADLELVYEDPAALVFALRSPNDGER